MLLERLHLLVHMLLLMLLLAIIFFLRDYVDATILMSLADAL